MNTEPQKPSPTQAAQLQEMAIQYAATLAQQFLAGPPEQATLFDFLIGEWTFMKRGYDPNGLLIEETRGSIHTKKTFDGRIIQEDFHEYLADGRAFRAGVALYTYAPSTSQWHVAAVDANVGSTSYSPKKVGDDIQYESIFSIQDVTLHFRNRWFDITSDSHHWEQYVSLDGKSWFKARDHSVVKKISD